jgi:hypothetical protein
MEEGQQARCCPTVKPEARVEYIRRYRARDRERKTGRNKTRER